MAPTARLPPKKDVALALLEQASMYIHLDPRADSVQVPAWFKKQPQLVLQVGLNMAVPIPDLHVDEQGLSCTLSFNRSPFFCMIPWRAVFALVGEKGQAMVWAEDVPAEVAAQAQAQKQPERPRGHLRSVAEGESAPPPTAPLAEKAGEPKPAPKKSAKNRAPVREVKAAAAPKRASKAAAKAKPASKAAAKKAEAPKVSAAKKPSAPKPAPKKSLEAPAPKQPARPKAAVAAAKHAEKPMAARGASEGAKPKRELPPYLRVVK
jgi:stringent starvation protein B